MRGPSLVELMGHHNSATLAATVHTMNVSSHIARVRINRVRLPILLVVSGTGKMNISLSPFVLENLVSRDGFGSPVPRVSLLFSILRLNLVPISAVASIYLFQPPNVIGSVPSLSGHAIVYPRCIIIKSLRPLYICV